MKKLFVMAVLVVGLTTFAQKKGEGRKEMSPEQRTEMAVKKMTKELDLNEKQQVQVKELLASQKEHRMGMVEKRKDMKANGEKPTAEQREAMKAKMVENKEAVKTKMKTILTDEQFKKWESNMENRKENMMERRAKMKEEKGKKTE